MKKKVVAVVVTAVAVGVGVGIVYFQSIGSRSAKKTFPGITPTHIVDSEEERACAGAGGSVAMFPHGCMDTCEYAHGGVACTDMPAQGCNCGDGKCWNGTTCEPDGKACADAGGTWGLLTHCRDRCTNLDVAGEENCALGEKKYEGCDCGPGQCWTGTACKPNRSWRTPDQ